MIPARAIWRRPHVGTETVYSQSRALTVLIIRTPNAALQLWITPHLPLVGARVGCHKICPSDEPFDHLPRRAARAHDAVRAHRAVGQADPRRAGMESVLP